jgi:ribosome-binding factor A
MDQEGAKQVSWSAYSTCTTGDDFPEQILLTDHMSKAAAPSQRMLRAGELIRHALADVFLRGETGDPELEKLGASVHEVQMSPDLKIATAYVRPLVQGQEQKLLHACTRNQKYIKGLIAPKVDMKFMPQLRFRVDTALDYAAKIDDLLRSPEVARDLKKD